MRDMRWNRRAGGLKRTRDRASAQEEQGLKVRLKKQFCLVCRRPQNLNHIGSKIESEAAGGYHKSISNEISLSALVDVFARIGGWLDNDAVTMKWMNQCIISLPQICIQPKSCWYRHKLQRVKVPKCSLHGSLMFP